MNMSLSERAFARLHSQSISFSANVKNASAPAQSVSLPQDTFVRSAPASAPSLPKAASLQFGGRFTTNSTRIRDGLEDGMKNGNIESIKAAFDYAYQHDKDLVALSFTLHDFGLGEVPLSEKAVDHMLSLANPAAGAQQEPFNKACEVAKYLVDSDPGMVQGIVYKDPTQRYHSERQKVSLKIQELNHHRTPESVAIRQQLQGFKEALETQQGVINEYYDENPGLVNLLGQIERELNPYRYS